MAFAECEGVPEVWERVKRSMRTMRLQSMAFALLSMPVAAATYTVDSVQQRYPWNGMVDAGLSLILR